jgi:signal peptidase
MSQMVDTVDVVDIIDEVDAAGTVDVVDTVDAVDVVDTVDVIVPAGTTRKRYARRAGGWVLTLLLAVLALMTVATAAGWFAITPVLSGSMRPGYNPGDAMLTKRVSVNSLHVGDIVNIKVPPQQGGGQRVHRIVAIRHQGTAVAVRTKGDANNLVDPGWFVLKGNQYRTVARLPWVGWLTDFRAANGGLLIVGAATVVGAISLAQRLRGRRSRATAAVTGPPAGL